MRTLVPRTLVIDHVWRALICKELQVLLVADYCQICVDRIKLGQLDVAVDRLIGIICSWQGVDQMCRSRRYQRYPSSAM